MLSGVSASFLILAIVILQGLTANTCNNNNNNMQSVETRMNLCKARERCAGCEYAAVKFGIESAPVGSLVKLLNPTGCLSSEVDMISVKPGAPEAKSHVEDD